MMAMKFFRPTIHLSRELELEVWRESNLVESYGTSKVGLALAAARRGFSVFTMGEPRKHSFVDAIADKIPGIDIDTLELLYKDTSRKFRAMKLRNVNRKIKLQEMRALLRKSQIPILLTDTSLFGGEERLPHWIVITGYSGSNWYVNNPLAESANTRVRENRLSENLGYRGVRCAVILHGIRKTVDGQPYPSHREDD
jgi:hypothetical protein